MAIFQFANCESLPEGFCGFARNRNHDRQRIISIIIIIIIIIKPLLKIFNECSGNLTGVGESTLLEDFQ